MSLDRISVEAVSTVLALCLVFLCSSVYAKEDIEAGTFNLYFENDLFAEQDQNYTNGLRFSWVSPDVSDYEEDERLPKWLRSASKRINFLHDSQRGPQKNIVVSLGQQMYTPEDYASTEVVQDDRPYAGWLYLSFAYHSRDERMMNTAEMRIGMIGPAAYAEEAQNFIHEERDFDTFQGWDNQLDNELGLIFLVERKYKLLNKTPQDGRLGYDFITHYGATLGNVATYINVGAEFRTGWYIPHDFGTSSVRPGGDNSAPDAHWDPRQADDGRWGVHGFITLDARLVGRDIFLDGNTFEDSHSVDKEILVADVAIGVSTVLSGVKISFAQIFRTKEFKEQDGQASFGSLSVSYSF